MNQYVETVRKNNGYLYVLRRTLPPWRWRENLSELVRLCPKYGIDEVCVKIDICNPAFGGTEQHAFSLAIHGQNPLFSVLEALPGAEEVTEFVDPDFKRIFPGTTAFANPLGGRIVVFPLEIAGLCGGFKTPTRKKWLCSLLSWIARGALPMVVGGDRSLLPIRIDRENDILAGVCNLSLDALDDVTVSLGCARRAERLLRLEYGASEWVAYPDFEQDGETLRIHVPRLTFDSPVYFSIICRKEEA